MIRSAGAHNATNTSIASTTATAMAAAIAPAQPASAQLLRDRCGFLQMVLQELELVLQDFDEGVAETVDLLLERLLAVDLEAHDREQRRPAIGC